jgi:hypothetical protein
MEFFAALAVLVGLVWAPVFLLRASLVGGAVLFVVLSDCLGLEFLSIDAGPMNVSIDRLFLVALGAAFVVQRWLGRTQRRPWGREEAILAGLVALLVTSTFTHDWRLASLQAVPVVQHLINGYLIPLAIYWIVRQSPITERQLLGVYAGIVAFGAYLAVTGVCEVTCQWSLVFPKHIADATLGIHFGRARGPMLNSITYGMALSCAILCGWMLWPRVGRWWQFVLLALLPLGLAGIFFSYTRSVWIGAALGLGILMVATLRGAWRIAVPGTILAVGLLVAAANSDRLLAFNRTDNTAAQTRESVTARASFTYVSWKMFQDRPLFGFGFGQFPTAKWPYLSDRTTPLQLEPIRNWSHHNTYLSILTELGLVGLLAFVGLFAAWGATAWRLWRAAAAPDWARGQGILLLALMSVYLVQCLFHEMTFTPRDHSLVFLFAGLAVGLAHDVVASSPARTWTLLEKPSFARGASARVV